MDPANDKKNNGEGNGTEGMTAEQLKMKDLKGYQEFVNICKEQTYDDALKGTAKTAFGNAMARLISIPSEIETMLFLHDQGKILIREVVPGDIPVSCIAGIGKSYRERLNIDNGVDIQFSDGEFPPGKTDTAFVDVKNVNLKTNGENYDNLLIEVSGRNGGKWDPARSWGAHYMDGSTNRYIAYVRDGKRYGGKLATEIDAFSEDKTEAENAREIIKYFSENRELLDHDIYIVRGTDINKSIDDKREAYKNADEQKKKAMVIITGNTMSYFERLSNWRKKYPLMEVSRTADGWTVKHTGTGTFEINTKQAQKNISSSKAEAGAVEQFRKLQDKQRDGLTERELLGMYDY